MISAQSPQAIHASFHADVFISILDRISHRLHKHLRSGIHIFFQRPVGREIDHPDLFALIDAGRTAERKEIDCERLG